MMPPCRQYPASPGVSIRTTTLEPGASVVFTQGLRDSP